MILTIKCIQSNICINNHYDHHFIAPKLYTMKQSFILSIFLFFTIIGFSQVTNSDFKTDSIAVQKSVQYTCSMHPEVITDKPGYCPKCGMQLVEKSKLSDSKNTSMMHPMMMDGMNDSNHKKKFPMMLIMAGMMVFMGIFVMVSHNR